MMHLIGLCPLSLHFPFSFLFNTHHTTKGKSMFKIRYISLLSFFVLSFAVNAQMFKGKVTLSIVDEETGSLKPLEYFTNGKDAAFSIEEQGMSVTLMMKEDKVLMVLHPMKMYMEMPIGEGDLKADTLIDETSIVKTGETKTINGLFCEKYLIKSKDEGDMIAWFTKEIGGFFLFKLAGKDNNGPQMFGDMKDLASQFPVLILKKDGDTELMVLELTKFEKVDVPDSMFEIPAGYKSMENSNFGQ
jgi:hypothetical protein